MEQERRNHKEELAQMKRRNAELEASVRSGAIQKQEHQGKIAQYQGEIAHVRERNSELEACVRMCTKREQDDKREIEQLQVFIQ
jgi:hypothetical protein